MNPLSVQALGFLAVEVGPISDTAIKALIAVVVSSLVAGVCSLIAFFAVGKYIIDRVFPARFEVVTTALKELHVDNERLEGKLETIADRLSNRAADLEARVRVLEDRAHRRDGEKPNE